MKSSTDAMRVIFAVSLVLLVAIASFGVGIASERYVFQPRFDNAPNGSPGVSSVRGDTEPDDTQVTVDRIEEVLDLLESEYYYGPVDREQRLYEALEGMVNGLPDDYTVYLRPSDTRMSREMMSGEYEGIGIWVDSPDGRLTVISPMKNSPAENAGIEAGDVIIAVDGVSIEDVAQDEAVRMVRGPEGTSVRLTIERQGVEGTLNFDVLREKIESPAVFYEMLDGGIAHITITIFGDRTTEELDRSLEAAQRDGATGIILDLRSNGGGWVNTAQEMIGRFVPVDAGPALYESTNPEQSSDKADPIIAGDVTEYDLPLVLLVNKGTASASEIVAGALRDYDRAVIIGTNTFGKGSIQRIHQFPDGSSARITIAEWLTPGKHRIESDGIPPDIEVALPEGWTSDDPDLQLQRAIDYLITGE